MTPNEQNCAIAKVCGWTHFTPDTVQYTARRSDGKWGEIPKYTTDLNAMHEAEMWMFESYETLEGAERLSLYTRYLVKLKHPLFATAAQRAKAFLRTLNLWEEEA